jgi:ketosteroid isomerase-like protein
MRRPILLLLTAFSFYAVSSCKSSGNTENRTANAAVFDKQWAQTFIDSMNATFSSQITAGDSAGLASHYWPDAELLLDNSEPAKGKNIISAWGSLARMGVKAMKFTTTDITGTPDFLIETGAYDMTGNENTLLDKGKYVVIWEKRNGEWRLYRDIGCTSMPPKQ